MEVIKIMFFAIGSFFGTENSQIAAEKTTVSIDPSMMTIEIIQENIFTIVKTKEDNINISKELIPIIKNTAQWAAELKDYPTKSYEFYDSGNGELHAKIIFKYNKVEDLGDFAMDLIDEGKYSMINIPNWNLATVDGMLNGNYWHFPIDKKFTFTLEPFKDIPEEYKVYKKSLLSMWELAK